MLSTAPECRFEVERGPDWLLVRVVDLDRDVSNVVSLSNEIWSIMEQHFTYRLVLELDQVNLLNSHLVGQLVSLYKRIRDHNGVMRLCGLSAYNRMVLRTCHLEDHFLPYQDRQDAVMAGNGPRRPR